MIWIFFYLLGAIFTYLWANQMYQRENNVPIDFPESIGIMIFWPIALMFCFLCKI